MKIDKERQREIYIRMRYLKRKEEIAKKRMKEKRQAIITYLLVIAFPLLWMLLSSIANLD